MIISTNLDSNENLFRYSVTYDFEAFNHLTWDRSRFINEITFAYEWIKILNDDLLIKEYDTMTVNEKLNEKSRILHFRKTAYVSKSSIILISIKLLKDEKTLWNMHIDTIDVKDTPYLYLSSKSILNFILSNTFHLIMSRLMLILSNQKKISMQYQKKFLENFIFV
jgi:hypothetical protein